MPLTIIKRKNRKNYYVRGTVLGQNVFESTGTSRKAEAERYAIKREQEIYDQKVLGKVVNSTFADAVIVYLDLGGDKTYIKPLLEYFNTTPLAQIDQRKVDNACKALKPNVSNATLNRAIYTPMSAIMRRAYEHGLCSYKTFKKRKIKETPVEWVSIEWFEQVWPHCNPHLKAILTFLPYTGCRIGEILRLEMSDIDMDDQTAYIKKTKTSTPRTVFLPDILIERLKEYFQYQIDQGKPVVDRVFEYRHHETINNEIKRIVKRANKVIAQWNIDHPKAPKPLLKYYSTHKVGSHTYATWMMRDAGLNVRQLLGTGRWKDVKSVIRYTHTTASEEGRKASLLKIKSNKLLPLPTQNFRKPVPNPCHRHNNAVPVNDNRGIFTLRSKGKNGADDGVRTHDFHLGNLNYGIWQNVVDTRIDCKSMAYWRMLLHENKWI